MKIAAWLLLVLVATLLVVPARAGDCYTGPRTGHTYNTQKQIYEPIKIVEKVVLVETLVVPVPVPAQLFVNLSPVASYPPVTVSSQALAGVQRTTDATTARLDRLESLLLKFAEQRTQPAAPPAQALRDLPPAIPGIAPPASAPVLPTEARQEQRQDPAALLGQAAGVLQARCAMCHTGPKSRGDVQLFNQEGALEITGADPETIWKEIRTDRMPKLPQKLSASEKAIVKQWTDSMTVDDGKRRR